MGLEAARLADFRVGKPIGAGSSARVFEATHLASGRPVALKLLGPSARRSPELRERLAREAVMLAGVHSRHVGRILGFGYELDQPFLVLERLHGDPLDKVLKRDRDP